jgi:uncharacterized membrane protein YbhN (UPF0104 family)
VALSVVLLALLARRVEWRGVSDVLRGVRPMPLVVALTVFLAAQLLSAAKWQSIARTLGCAAALLRHVRLYFAGMFLSLFLPGFIGGDLFRAMALAGGTRGWLPTKATLWSVFLERLTGLWGLSLLLAVGLSLSGPADWLRKVGAVAGVMVCGAPWFYARLTTRHGAGGDRRGMMGVAYDGRRAGPVLLISFLVQALYAGVHLLVATALGIGLGWGPWLWIAPAVGLLASLPISLGGLGPREWGYLVTLQWAGLDRERAVAFAAAWLALVTVASLAGGMGLLGGRLGPGITRATSGSRDSGSVTTDHRQDP